MKLPWSKEELAGIPLLFDRTFPDIVDNRSKTPPALAGEDFVTHELEYHGTFYHFHLTLDTIHDFSQTLTVKGCGSSTQGSYSSARHIISS